ncbi:MAG: tRNA uridine-5-carboxymethylaminomethyl(34) synthesis GTPase MnmE, partial [Candidatus Omnitrophica bacterium]|nr:tRNA uridine-5-carboxymethylaminomethyl(34) synthesis GTPase MnmE [Candidatus Omnitrophota bacterium]
LGRSGIGIVRMSGPDAIRIAEEIFVSKDKKPVSSFKSHTIHYGFIVEDLSQSAQPTISTLGVEMVDEVLLTVMKAPRTYTRQDIVEINCHGGMVALRKVLKLCLRHGARLANPGEFTLRAFLNGRIDLTQAEAVLNIVDAKTEEALKVATRQLEGSLSKILNSIHKNLLDIVSEFEALLDFPEEEIEESQKEEIISRLEDTIKELDKLLEHSREGRLIQEGIKCVICGKPNVGKSSLMNALLGKERVIVTPIPGTTRDVVEEIVDLHGIPLRIADTAGIIETEDLVEKEGIERAKREMENADLIILVLDTTQGINSDDIFLLERIKDKNHIICVNKIDLKSEMDLEVVEKKFGIQNVVRTSALKNQGITELKDRIYSLFLNEEIDFSVPLITNLRHIEAIRKVKEKVLVAIDSFKEGRYLEIITQELKDALSEISSLLGKEITEEVLNTIFSRFCIGK